MIRAINLTSSSHGSVTTAIGMLGSQGAVDGIGNVVRLYRPLALMYVFPSRTLYFGDANYRIGKAVQVFVNNEWTYNVTTIVGKTGAAGAEDGLGR